MVHKEFMSKRELKAYEEMEARVEELNSTFKVGDLVNVRNDFGGIDLDKIAHPISIMSGGIVAWLEKKRCYLADRVTKIG